MLQGVLRLGKEKADRENQPQGNAGFKNRIYAQEGTRVQETFRKFFHVWFMASRLGI